MGESGETPHDELIRRLAFARDGLAIGVRSMLKIDADWHAVGDAVADIARFARRAGVLAVNASIEAAYASENGRFGIVAERMRELSAATQQAARTVNRLAALTRGELAVTLAAMESSRGDAVRILEDVAARAEAAAIALLNERADAAHARIIANDASIEQAAAIMATIDAISGDALLLAINAAIEAAQAGTQGVGFAVIADEIGRLARDVDASVTRVTALLVSISDRSTRLRDASSQFNAGFPALRAAAERVLDTHLVS